MRTKEVLKHVNIMLEAIEDKSKMTDEIKRKYNFQPSRWGRREYYEGYDVRQMLGISSYKSYQITKTMLKKMKVFLDEAVKQGFYGDVEFRTGYRNGMWASTRTGSTDEKKGEMVLYRSFESDSDYWEIRKDRDTKITQGLLTKTEIRKYIKDNYI